MTPYEIACELVKNSNYTLESDYSTVREVWDVTLPVWEEEKLFDDLSQEQRLELAQYQSDEDKRPTLNLYSKVWVYLEEIDKWVLVHSSNDFRSEFSYKPEYVLIEKGEDTYCYLIKDDLLLSKCITQATSAGGVVQLSLKDVKSIEVTVEAIDQYRRLIKDIENQKGIANVVYLRHEYNYSKFEVQMNKEIYIEALQKQIDCLLKDLKNHYPLVDFI